MGQLGLSPARQAFETGVAAGRVCSGALLLVRACMAVQTAPRAAGYSDTAGMHASENIERRGCYPPASHRRWESLWPTVGGAVTYPAFCL